MSIGHYDSPFGRIALHFEEDVLTRLCFAEQIQSESASFSEPLCKEKLLRRLTDWLDRYFAGNDPGVLDVPIKPAGSAFALKVWHELMNIPYGSTLTYGQLSAVVAQRCGRPRMSAQAVGAALSKNPILIIIPCHRVIGSDGSLVGYSGGLDRKLFLLQLESSGSVLYK